MDDEIMTKPSPSAFACHFYEDNMKMWPEFFMSSLNSFSEPVTGLRDEKPAH